MKQSNILKILRVNMSLVSFFLVQTGHLVWLDRLYSGSLSKVKGAERPDLLDLLDSPAKGLHLHLRFRNSAGEKEEVEKLRGEKKILFGGSLRSQEQLIHLHCRCSKEARQRPWFLPCSPTPSFIRWRVQRNSDFSPKKQLKTIPKQEVLREIKPLLLISVKYKRIIHSPKNRRKYRVLFLCKDYPETQCIQGTWDLIQSLFNW